ncbi:MAG: class I SAM-dependent methyltransferase [Candidatus Accumulibacter meliphilus]|uniref:Class I SAM-dependent methyltransferase n=1 Tax=Candidatus Accumulibacter meliphilus TaxID=2211374 RepID=A0A369XPX3_9PROT|nr:MAG: class I SAM-dependent methyltransferase [Candidatus Accumulibacter meliphilus]
MDVPRQGTFHHQPSAKLTLRRSVMDAAYFKDPDHGVWRRKNFAGIRYSDGLAAESAILDIVRSCSDLSVGSKELARHICDWPTEYHFSATRANLLRPFCIDKDKHVLELGCGCGALTRYLGESGATVTAVEGSLVRASITAARCRDLPNVHIVADSIQLFKPCMQFDIVTLIGVLEYAPIFIGGENPALQCLAIARRFLAPGGTLLLAIENQLGLKYFNGCTEDHVGELFFGLQDQYGAATPVTFGRAELQRLLNKAGFSATRFLLPFPDYKLPEILIAEDASAVPDLALHNLLARSQDRDYSGRRLRIFDEHLAWRPLARNGLLGDLANSFLVIAEAESSSAPPQLTTPWLAKIYSMSRRPTWVTETTIRLEPSGLRVSKLSPRKADEEEEVRIGPFTLLHQPSPDEAYIAGDLLLHKLQRLARESKLVEMAELGRQWLGLLFQGPPPTTFGLANQQVPGSFIDCIPANLISAETGELIMIDKEWQLREPIPMAWVILRGLVNTLYQCKFPHDFGQRTCSAVISELLALMGTTVSASLYEEISVLENIFQDACHDGRAPKPTFLTALENCVPRLPAVERISEIEDLLAENRSYKKALSCIENSMSWHITKPLRFLARVFMRH